MKRFSFEFRKPEYFENYSDGELYGVIVGLITNYVPEILLTASVKSLREEDFIQREEAHLMYSFTNFKLEDVA